MELTPPAVHCVIVDDHVMLLDLLAGVVRTVPGVVISATATDVTDAGRIAALDAVDLLIVDRRLASGDGMDLVRSVLARHPRMKCIVITGSTIDFVCPPDLMDCVVAVIDKSHACDMLLAEINRIVGTPAPAAGGPPLDDVQSRLTPRELELFIALGDGLTNKEVGQRFGITTRTVETHRKAISRKLGQSGSALIRLATLHRQAGLSRDRGAVPASGPSR
ncbi:MAG: response regulator transcription factor [Planctomycetaceae bacterium]